jgi:hypothetical protein
MTLEFILLLMAVFEAFQVQHVPDEINEAKFISVAIYIWTILKIIAEMIFGFSKITPDVNLAVKSLLMIASIFTAQLLLVILKFTNKEWFNDKSGMTTNNGKVMKMTQSKLVSINSRATRSVLSRNSS